MLSVGRGYRAAILAALLSCLAAGVALAQDNPIGKRLSEEELNHLLYGSTLYGKYVDGRPDWAEQTAVTGQLYDAADNWKEVGQWGMVGDAACYQYYNTGLRHCFDVYEADGRFYFYSAGTDYLVAYTTRVEREQIM